MTVVKNLLGSGIAGVAAQSIVGRVSNAQAATGATQGGQLFPSSIVAFTTSTSNYGPTLPADEYYSGPAENAGPYIRDDVKPYQSMIDGSMIEGRKAHREHLKRNNCIEAADMPLKTPERPRDNLKEQIAREVYNKLRY